MRVRVKGEHVTYSHIRRYGQEISAVEQVVRSHLAMNTLPEMANGFASVGNHDTALTSA